LGSEQYASRVFYIDGEQKATAEHLIGMLNGRGYEVATKVLPADTFWRAEPNQQNYYARKGTCPFCVKRVMRF
jgi:peptide methionine sulfoxide reductase MsrA